MRKGFLMMLPKQWRGPTAEQCACRAVGNALRMEKARNAHGIGKACGKSSRHLDMARALGRALKE
jgi:hypothetical protein